VVPGGLVLQQFAHNKTGSNSDLGSLAKANQVTPATSNYEYSVLGVSVSGSEQWGTVEENNDTTAYPVGNNQGTTESDSIWYGGQHSLQNFVVSGTCEPGNASCTSNPLIEITVITGQQYCKSGLHACYEVQTWKNGVWTHSDGYVDLTTGYQGGWPSDGTKHFGDHADITLGFLKSFGRLNLVADGHGTTNIVGYIPTSYWGQSTSYGFGNITEESLQTEVFEANPNWTTAPIPSMNYTYTNWADSNGNTLPTPTVDSPYSLVSSNSTGYVVSGGNGPTQTSAPFYGPSEADADNPGLSGYGTCLGNSGNSQTNGNHIVIWDCGSAGKAQQFNFDPNTGYLQTQDGGANGKCIDDPGNSTVNDTKVVLEPCGTSGTVWSLALVSGSNYVKYVGGSNGNMCLMDLNGSDTNGQQVEVAGCNNSTWLQWDAFSTWGYNFP
jgi:hypothetical protein